MPWKAFMQSSALTNSDQRRTHLVSALHCPRPICEIPRLCAYWLLQCAYRYLVDVAGFPTDDIPSFPND